MDIALVIIITVVVFLGVYKLKAEAPLPEKKPTIALFPKYIVEIPIPENLVHAQDPAAELERIMKPIGFERSGARGAVVKFSRGSVVGDFSIKHAKVDLIFPLPLKEVVPVHVRYGAVAAFDTGDLWKFCAELRSRVSRAA